MRRPWAGLKTRRERLGEPFLKISEVSPEVMKTERELFGCAYDVADNYRGGLWPELSNKDWKDVWKFLLNELRRRCPGFTDIQYAKALDQGFLDSR